MPASRPQRLVVAIDGPSGSGKSSVARGVASRLGVRYVDTGAMYRALTWWALEQGVDLADTDKVAALARELPIELGTDPEHPRVSVAGTDVGAAIRTAEISAAVSAVATNLGVRQELVRRQRALAAQGDVVVEGRDITTVVAPDAQVRILLTADEDVRIARRSAELAPSAASTASQLRERDRRDAQVVDFLTAAPGVTTIDSTELDFGQTVQAVVDLVRTTTRH